MVKILAALIFLIFSSAIANAASFFGVCSTACTWDNASTAMWSSTSGGATGVGPPGASDIVTFDTNTCVGGTTCTITTNANISITSLVMGTCTASTAGCILDFSVNNNNIAISSSFNASGSGLRTVKMGNGTWSFTSTSSAGSALWNAISTTNMTLVAGGSTIAYTGNSTTGTGAKLFNSTALTYNNVSFLGNGSYAFNGSANLTINALTLGPKANLRFVNGQTYTLSSLISTASLASPASVMTDLDAARSTISISSGTQSIANVAVKDMAFTGGATFNITNAFDLGNNIGATITPPSSGGGGGSNSFGQPGFK